MEEPKDTSIPLSDNPAGPIGGPEVAVPETNLPPDPVTGSRRQDGPDMRDMATRYYEKLTGLADSLREETNTLYEETRQYVGSHTMATIAGGFVAGLLIGVMIGRK